MTATVSFRDPAGQVALVEGRVLRAVGTESAADLREFLATPAAQNAERSGQMVRSTLLSGADAASALRHFPPDFSAAEVYEHERVPFQSFPGEWPAEMLHAAAELTLELATAALRHGFGLKDATPYNVMFRGPSPVFIDVLSFERRPPGSALWRAYAQFVRGFVLPLLAAKKFATPMRRAFAVGREGMEPSELYHLASPLHRVSPALLQFATMPVLLAARSDHITARSLEKSTSPQQARFVLQRIFNGLARTVRALRPNEGSRSRWSGYRTDAHCPEYHASKEAIVTRYLSDIGGKEVLDIGCNEGYIALAAARLGAMVVAVDTDPVAVGKLWRIARDARANVLPLVVDIASPTPSEGWLASERPGFLERASGAFDVVVLLGLLHHLLTTERVPIANVAALVANLTRRHAIVEFVPPADPMFSRLAGRQGLAYDHITREAFEAAFGRHFAIRDTMPVEGSDRVTYLLERPA